MIVLFAFQVPIQNLTAPSVLAIATGVYWLYRGWSVLARGRRRIAPASRVADALSGLVEVHGVATGPNTIYAPITGGSCFLYHSTIWQQSKSASHEWDKVAEENLHLPFFLDDSTGQMLIEPLGADLDLQSEFHKEYDPTLFFEPNKVPPAVSAFLARHRVVPARRIRIEECCIRPEGPVFIVGLVTQNPGIELRPVSHRAEGEGGSQRPGGAAENPGAETPEVIRLSVSTAPLGSEAMTLQSKISAALIKAGIRNPDAWEAAGVAYPETVPEGGTDSRGGDTSAIGMKEKHVPEFEPVTAPALVLMKGPEGTPLLISWRSRRDLGQKYVWRCAIMLLAGTVLWLAGLYGLLLRFHPR